MPTEPTLTARSWRSACLKRCRQIAALPVIALLTACYNDPVQPDPPADPDTAAVVMPILGLGPVQERFTSELAVFGDWAFTGTWGGGSSRHTGNALKIWNVAGFAPVLHDSIIVSGAQTLGDVHISPADQLMAVATEFVPGSIILYDISDPSSPRQLSRFQEESTLLGVHTAKLARVDGRLYAFASIAALSGGALVIVDVTDPERPREVLNRLMGGPFIHDVFVRDGLLFTALWNQGVTIWDIGGGGRGGSPGNPIQLGNHPMSAAHNVYWSGYAPGVISSDFLFVGQEIPASPFGVASQGDIHVLDISDPGTPREVAFFHLPTAGTHNFSVDEQGGVLYAAYYNAGVRALDVRGDLASCEPAHRDARGRCDLMAMGREIGTGLLDFGSSVYTWGVQWVNGDLYASDMLHGLFKLDARELGR